MSTINTVTPGSINLNQLEAQKLKDLQNRSQNLRTKGEETDKKLRESAEQFEAIFVQQLIKSMRSSVQKGGLISGGRAEEIFQEMLDGKYSEVISGSKSLNLADLIYRELKQRKP
jgi:flagellar protein FlgJ